MPSRPSLLRVAGALLLLLLAAPPPDTKAGSRREAEAAFAEGVRLYEEERYADAWASWRRVIDEGRLSGALAINLGNAAYRLGELGWAIYYYELGLRLDPGDPDIASNLELARREAIGVERTARDSPLLRGLDALQARITPARAARLAAGSFWLFCALQALCWLLPGRRPARTGRWVAAALLGAALLLATAKGLQQSIRPEAITVAAIGARSEPDEEASVEFRLPPGSPVDLGRRAPGWREIVVSASLRGWVGEGDVASFADPR